MINTFEEFKKGIGRVGVNPAGNDDDVAELKKIVEIKNLQRLKLFRENEELRKKSVDKNLNEMIAKVGEELRMQIRVNEQIEERIERIIGNGKGKGFTERGKITDVKSGRTVMDKSPLKPPRSRCDKKEIEISNSLACAIEMAQKNLEKCKKEKRSVSPGLSSTNLRYSTPPNQRLLNQSLLSNR
jgi:hypothetical protein